MNDVLKEVTEEPLNLTEEPLKQLSSEYVNCTVSEGVLNPELLYEEWKQFLWGLDIFPKLDSDLESDLEVLEETLCAIAPVGTSFGTLEGDGSHFGFWEDENDDSL